MALEETRKINNGQPALHAFCLAALNAKEGETVVHIGAGTGYYTAVLAAIVGPTGKVFGYEIDPELADRAAKNLASLAHVILYPRSGAEGSLPKCDAIYVSAGATAPLDIWLDALNPGGRLLFPLTPDGVGDMPGAGAMLLVIRSAQNQFDARFVSAVMIIPCIGARDSEMAKKLAEAYKRGDAARVASLRRKIPPDETCWCAGDGWWLSTARNI